MRKKLILLISVIFLMGNIGCLMNKQENRKLLLSYMENKYQEEFVYKESYAGQYGAEYTYAVLESTDYPGWEILARVTWIDGLVCYEDNYPAYLLQGKIESEMKRIAGEYFGNCHVTYQIPQFVFPKQFGADTTVEAFLSSKEVNAEILIMPEVQCSREVWERNLEEFRKELADKGYYVRGAVLGEKGELIFSIGECGEFGYMRWLEP